MIPPQSLPASQRKNAEDATPPRARLGSVLRVGFRDIWDRLGLVIALSLTWTWLFFLAFTLWRLIPPFTPSPVVSLLGVALLVLLLSAPTAGACAVAHRISAREEVSYADFWRETVRLLRPATCLGLFQALVGSVFAVNLWFYVGLRSLSGNIAAILCLYALLFWAMMAVYHFPTLVAQEQGLFDEPDRPARRGVGSALRRAFYLALSAPFFTLGLLGTLLLVSAPIFLLLPLLPLLWAGTLALLTTHATRALLIQHGALPPPLLEEAIPDEQFHLNTRG